MNFWVLMTHQLNDQPPILKTCVYCTHERCTSRFDRVSMHIMHATTNDQDILHINIIKDIHLPSSYTKKIVHKEEDLKSTEREIERKREKEGEYYILASFWLYFYPYRFERPTKKWINFHFLFFFFWADNITASYLFFS